MRPRAGMHGGVHGGVRSVKAGCWTALARAGVAALLSVALLGPGASAPVANARLLLAAQVACPSNVADRLRSTGTARQLVTVEASMWRGVVAEVALWRRAGGCWRQLQGPWTAWIGRNGFSDRHREGDGTTPTGMYAIGPVVYGNAANPGTRLSYHRLVCGDWWDEDPTSGGYNTFQHVPCGQAPPFGGASEALWTETAAYPSFAVVEYNTHPVVPYAGSAIFVHASTGTPTAGCVALPLGDLDVMLRWLRPSPRPYIVMGPAAEITRF